MMQFKKTVCLALTGAVILGGLGTPAWAAEVRQTSEPVFAVERATNRFHMTIPAGTRVEADTSSSLAPGAVVTINASYAPASASVDFGLMDSDGIFHYTNEKDGSINQSIQIKEWGEYTLSIRNNASYEIDVSGYVNY